MRRALGVRATSFALLAPLLALVLGCASERGLRRFEYVERHMGCTARVVLYAPSDDAARDAAREAFDVIAELDRQLTDWDEHGLVARLARGETAPVGLPEPFLDVLARARELAELTDGAFDVTIGPLTRAWRDARRHDTLPAPRDVDAALALVGGRGMRIDRARRAIAGWRAGTRLDFGGIGKGAGADRALARLRTLGVTRALVGIEGDLALGDPPPGERGWRVATGASARELGETLLLARCGVSTSGVAEQFVEIDGVRYSHVIDPRTGRPLARHVRTTLVAHDATTADALATAVSVLGLEQGVELAERIAGVEARVEERGPPDEGGELVERETKGYAALVVDRAPRERERPSRSTAPDPRP